MITKEGCVTDMVFIVACRFNSMADLRKNPSPKDKMLGKAPTESSPLLFNNGRQDYKLDYPSGCHCIYDDTVSALWKPQDRKVEAIEHD